MSLITGSFCNGGSAKTTPLLLLETSMQCVVA
jgi:hypothetical protein